MKVELLYILCNYTRYIGARGGLGRRLLLSLDLRKNSSSAYKYSNQKLHQRDTHFHSPVSFMIRDWIKESTVLHTPCFSSFLFPGLKKTVFSDFPICTYTERNTSYILKNVEIHFVSLTKSILLKGENNFYFSTISLHIACDDLLNFNLSIQFKNSI